MTDKNQAKQQIKIADNLPGIEYSNALQIGHNKEEIQMIFMNIMGGGGKVVGKIITSPSHFKRMVEAMKDNLDKFESKHGKVEKSDGPSKEEIGFKA